MTARTYAGATPDCSRSEASQRLGSRMVSLASKRVMTQLSRALFAVLTGMSFAALGLVGGCASPGSDPGRPPDAAVAPEEGQCPYRTAYVFWPTKASEDKSPDDVEISQRLGKAYSAFLAQRGITILSDPERAYLLGHVSGTSNVADPAGIVAYLEIRATPDLQGRTHNATQFSKDDHGTMAACSTLIQSPANQIEGVAERAANLAAEHLEPHLDEQCADWQSGSWAEEARLEKIRQELVGEIGRVRREREERQRKQLEIRPAETPPLGSE